MKSTCIFLAALFFSIQVFSQTQAIKPSLSNKIILHDGQKVIIETNVTIESNMSPGMDVTSSTSTVNLLEVKSSTEKNYTISNTMTKLKMNMDMMGQSTSYDSEKKEDQESDMGKSLSAKLNKPVDVVINSSTGLAETAASPQMKKDIDEGNPMEGLLQMFGNNNEGDFVAGSFEMIPAGKNVGDSWSDSTIEKDRKTRRKYLLKSINGNEAVTEIITEIDAVNNVEVQGMSMEITSNTKTTSAITSDIATGMIKMKTNQAVINGSMQVMGQSVPISAKATTTSIYK
jgi:hypothetical protein